MNKYSFLIIAVLSGITISLLRSRQRLIEEKDSYKSNTEALMSEVRRIQADSSTMALDIKTLTMSLDEYKRFRAEDEEKIKKLQILAKGLAAADMHELMFIYELKERLTVCLTVIAHLRARKETRWHSFAENLDYPEKSDAWLCYVNSKKNGDQITMIRRDLVKGGETYEHRD